MNEQTNNSNALGWGEKLAFALGSTGKDMLLGLSNLLLFFYTDVFGIAAATAGSIFLIARIIDAFTDLFIGYAIEHTHTKWGKMRPYILYGAIPFAAFSALIFMKPDLAEDGKIAYAFITYTIYMVLYSLVSIPHAGLNALMTRDVKEMARLSGLLIVGSSIGMLIATSGTMAIVAQASSPSEGFKLAGVIISILGAIFLLICFAKTRERVVENNADAGEKITLLFAAKFVFRNAPLLLLSSMYVLTMIGMMSRVTTLLYYCKYNLGSEELFGPLNLAGMVIGLALTVIVANYLLSRFDKKIVLGGASVAYILFNGMLYCIPSASLGMTEVVAAISLSIVSVLILCHWSMLPDVVEYSAWRLGLRGDGIIYAVFNFLQKLAMAIGGALAGWLLASSGYIPNVVQTESALQSILCLQIIVPSIASVLTLVILMIYPLKKSVLTQIREESAVSR